MYCQSCGIAIDPAMRFCNRCGTSVLSPSDAADITKSFKRLDNYLDGLFWITAFGIGLTAGGMVLLKKTGFSDSFILAFVILSSTAFLINFVINLWIVFGIVRQSKKVLSQTQANTKELEPMKPQPSLQPASVTDNTTRSFEPIYNKRNSD
jgi:hypothetical protein